MSYAKAFSVMGELSGDIKAIQAKMTIQLDQLLVFQTPVDEGRARGNWIVSQQTPDEREVSVSNPGQAAQSALSQAKREAAKTVPFSLTYIQNNLPYIQRLNEGWSAQAPSRYIERAIAQVVNSE